EKQAVHQHVAKIDRQHVGKWLGQQSVKRIKIGVRRKQIEVSRASAAARIDCHRHEPQHRKQHHRRDEQQKDSPEYLADNDASYARRQAPRGGSRRSPRQHFATRSRLSRARFYRHGYASSYALVARVIWLLIRVITSSTKKTTILNAAAAPYNCSCWISLYD